jgi:hypothetical protein
MPDLLLPFLILGLAIVTSAVSHTSAGLQRPSGDSFFRAVMLRTIVGLGILALKANVTQAAPDGGDLVLVALVLMALEGAYALFVSPVLGKGQDF